jgi:hypothetical protein
MARFPVWPNALAGIDLFVDHVKKAGNRAGAPGRSTIRLN